MQYNLLLDRLENTIEIELQEQSRFIKSILETLEVSIDFDPDAPLTPQSKNKLLEDLRKFKIHIVSNSDRTMKIFVDDDLIAEWFKPIFKLQEDLSKIDPKKRLYLNMTINFWSIFEEEGSSE